MGLISSIKRGQRDGISTRRRARTALNLPTAPQVVARSRFAPPPHGSCMTVAEAMDLLHAVVKKKGESDLVAVISGPGDPLATPDITLELIRRIRERYHNMELGIKTLGIGSEKFAGELARLGADFIEMQVDGVSAEILAKLYAWIRPGRRTVNIVDGAESLIREQRRGVPALKSRGLSVSVCTVLYPGYNLDHVVRISAEAMELGADTLSLIPCRPVPGMEADLEVLSDEDLAAVKAAAEHYLPVVEPLAVDHSVVSATRGAGLAKKTPLRPSQERPNAAVVSSHGVDVDLHLGHALQFLIYGPREDGLTCLLEVRRAPEPGLGADRWKNVANLLNDCFVLLAAAAGEAPRRVFAEEGLEMVITEENIEGLVDVLYGGGKKGKKRALRA